MSRPRHGAGVVGRTPIVSALLVLAFLASTATPAFGEGVAGLDLRWSASAGCPLADEVEGMVAHFLGSGALTARAEMVAEIVVSRPSAQRWRLDLALTGGDFAGSFKRTLNGDSCGNLAEAAALILALAIDPNAAGATGTMDTGAGVRPSAQGGGPASPHGPDRARGGELGAAHEAPAGESPNKEDGGAPTAPAVAVAGARPPWPGPRVPPMAVRLWLAGDVGTLPDLAPGLGLALAIGDRLRGELTAAWWRTQQAASQIQPTSGVEIGLLTLGARSCGAPLRAVRCWACVGIEAGWMSGRGYGVSEQHTATSAWVAVAASLAATWQLSEHAHLWVEGGAVAPLRRPAFALQDYGTSQRSAAAAARTLAGLELRFP